MSDKPKNALAELAERLTPNKVINVNGNVVAVWVDNDAIVAAQRIVAELAKVDNDQYGRPMFMDSKCAIIKCRAIAEEGAGDGK